MPSVSGKLWKKFEGLGGGGEGKGKVQGKGKGIEKGKGKGIGKGKGKGEGKGKYFFDFFVASDYGFLTIFLYFRGRYVAGLEKAQASILR